MKVRELTIILQEPNEYIQKKKPSDYWSEVFKIPQEDNWDSVWLYRTHMPPSIVNVNSIVKKFPYIESLNLIGENFLAADSLVNLKNLRKLKRLVLKIASVEDDTKLLPLARCRKLEDLALLGEIFYLSGFDGLEKLKFLKKLIYDEWTYFEFEERMEDYIHTWQKLEILNLSRNYEGDITPLVKCKKLKELTVGDKIYICDEKLPREKIPKGIQPYYEKIEWKPEGYRDFLIIESKKQIKRLISSDYLEKKRKNKRERIGKN